MKVTGTKYSGYASRRGGFFLAMLGIAALTGGAIQPAAAGTYKSLHDFNAYPEGIGAFGGLAPGIDGSYYGATVVGGKFGLGTIFKVTATGVKLNVYDFPGDDGPGSPDGTITLGLDGAFYGTCERGAITPPAIFRFDPISGKTNIVVEIPALYALSSLVMGTDGAFYGTGTFGPTGYGSVFRWFPGGEVKLIHNFTKEEGGIYRTGETLGVGTDGYLYGTTNDGGAFGFGIVFKINHGGALIKLHDLSFDEGCQSVGAPTVGRDNYVWFTSSFGGPNNNGSIMKVGTNGKGFAVMHSFGQNEPNIQFGHLYQASDNRFYGGVLGGSNGLSDRSQIFSIGSDGSFKVVHELTIAEGQDVQSSLTQNADGQLYGVSNNSMFRVSTSGQFTTLKVIKPVEGEYPTGAPVVASDGNYYGTTSFGGAYNIGTIYRTTPAGITTTIHSFSYFENGSPTPLTLGADGKMYVATGQNFGLSGSVSRVGLDGSLTPIHTFLNDGVGRLTLGGDGRLYASSYSTVYAIGTNGNTVVVGSTNGFPFNSAVRAGDGNVYSVLSTGGDGYGAIYKIKGANVTIVHRFNPNTEGSGPTTLTLGPDGNLYGTATTTIFRYNVIPGTLTVLHDLSTSGDHNLLSNAAIKSDGTIYGIDVKDQFNPVLYSLDKNGIYTEQSILPKINNAAIGYQAELAVHPDGSIYGATNYAGTHNNGSLFHFLGL